MIGLSYVKWYFMFSVVKRLLWLFQVFYVELVHVWFTTATFKPLSHQNCGRYLRSSNLKVFSSENFLHSFCSRNRLFLVKPQLKVISFSQEKTWISLVACLIYILKLCLILNQYSWLTLWNLIFLLRFFHL